jgi:hypothetical protein
MQFGRNHHLHFTALALFLALACEIPAAAQNSQQQPSDLAQNASVNAGLGELQSEIRELKDMVLQLQRQTTASQAEISRLRQELEAQRAQSYAAAGEDQSWGQPGGTMAQLTQRLDHVEEDEQLLSGRVDEQYQTKLESASKYRVRFSGIVLFNLFGNSGSVENQDVPTWAVQRMPGAATGSVGGTLRQSILGFEAFGPDVFGAHSSGSVSFDFGGGFPGTYNGVDFGLVRLRTAALRLDWKDTSIIAGQDPLFLSPLSPTSFASVIEPPLAYAGNLYSWTPQLRVEHRFALAGGSTITLQGGFLDPLTGELPYQYGYGWYRSPDAGESSRQPAYAARVGYSHPMLGQSFSLGAGGYYSRQNWGFARMVNGYAATLDLNLPLSRRLALSGEFYRGQAIGGLGGTLGRNVVYNGAITDPNTMVLPLNTVGGWAQLKFRATPKLEFNAAFGEDNPFAADIRAFGEQSQTYGDPTLTRNRAAFGNVIYRPRSDLLLSLEYRRLRTFTIYDSSYEAGQINMSMGVLF